MEFASRSVPGPLCQTNQKPPPLATGNCSLRSPTAPRQSSSLPDPGQASSTFTEGLIPSAQAHLVPPEALLSCQHFLHSSLDIPASRACVRNAALRAGPAGGPPAPNCCPTSLLAPPPEFPLALSRMSKPGMTSKRLRERP